MNDYSRRDFNAIAARMYPSRAKLFADAPLKLVGIRGADDPAGRANSFAVYDDQILVFIHGVCTGTWVASTDPTWYFVQNPIIRDETGALHSGQLCPGVHLFGPHTLHGKYPCFGQAEDVHAYRLKQDGTVDHIEYGDFAICVHSGGAGMNTNRFSLGCQIVRNDDGYFGEPTWNKFYLPVRDALRASGQEAFPYFLVNAADLAATAPAPVRPSNPVVHQSTASLGVHAPLPATAALPPVPVIPTATADLNLFSNALGGDAALADVATGKSGALVRKVPAVVTLGIDRVQDALTQLGYPTGLGAGNRDRGYFGPRTQAALVQFQRDKPGLPPGGAVTRETLFALDKAILARERPSADPVRKPEDDPPVVVTVLPRTDGYLPPPTARATFLRNVRFDQAERIGEKYLRKFAVADQNLCPRDPSRCRTILRFGDEAIYFESKLAVDTDGSPRAKDIDPNPEDASLSTSWTYPGTNEPFDSEQIPYIVLPQRDRRNGDNFVTDMGLTLGSLAVVIYRNRIAGAIFADAGPSLKIGEGSVHLHEMLGVNPWRHPQREILDASISDSVMFFVFKQTVSSRLTLANAVDTIQEQARECFTRLGGVWPAAV